MPLFVQSKDGSDVPSILENPSNTVEELENILNVSNHLT